MMGQLPAQQNTLFYEFCLEKHIPEDHLLRQIDQFLNFNEIRKHLQAYYSHTGRPSIDPELMIRMLLIGYCYGIRSERRLCEEQSLNDDDVDIHVCGDYAKYKHLGSNDFLPFVDVSPSGPAQLQDYINLGFEHIVLEQTNGTN